MRASDSGSGLGIKFLPARLVRDDLFTVGMIFVFLQEPAVFFAGHLVFAQELFAAEFIPSPEAAATLLG